MNRMLIGALCAIGTSILIQYARYEHGFEFPVCLALMPALFGGVMLGAWWDRRQSRKLW